MNVSGRREPCARGLFDLRLSWMRWVTGVVAAFLVGCGPNGDPEGFPRLAFIQGDEVRVIGAGEFPETYEALEPLRESAESPSEVAWTDDGTLAFLQRQRLGLVGPGGVVEHGPYDCGFSPPQMTSFDVVGGHVLMGASGSPSHGDGATGHCTTVIDAAAGPGEEPWATGTRDVSTDGARRVMSCRFREDEGTVARLENAITGDELWELSPGGCPVLAPRSGLLAFHEEGRLTVGLADDPSSWAWLIQGFGFGLMWSPDGESLLFQRSSEEWAVVSAASGKLVGTFATSHARWSPSGQFLRAEHACDGGERSIEIVANEPGLPAVWSSGCGPWGAPALSPDGRFLAVTEWVDAESRMYVLSQSGRQWRFDGAHSPAWRPEL